MMTMLLFGMTAGLSGCAKTQANKGNADLPSSSSVAYESAVPYDEKGEAQEEESSKTKKELPAAKKAEASEDLAALSTTTIEGDAFSTGDLQDHDLTLVNIFATWCMPCVQEIPELEKLYQEMKDQKVGVVGMAIDTVDRVDVTGEAVVNDSITDVAAMIKDKTGATYPFVVPDAAFMNGRGQNVTAVPETFFVDKEGKIVGETYVGGRNYEAWKEIVEKTLDTMKG